MAVNYNNIHGNLCSRSKNRKLKKSTYLLNYYFAILFFFCILIFYTFFYKTNNKLYKLINNKILL